MLINYIYNGKLINKIDQANAFEMAIVLTADLSTVVR